MTIKWVQMDPLVMNGEPFCYGSRLTVRQVLEARANGYTVVDLLKDNPELRQGTIESVRKVRKLTRELGLLNPVATRLWKALGIYADD